MIWTVLAGLFGYGLFHLFISRFETGDIYPAYSSLRSDPLGTKALYESLDRLPVPLVMRSFQSPHLSGRSGDQTFLVSGVSPSFLIRPNPPFIQLIRHLASKGGRMVITINPAAEFYAGPVSKGSIGSYLGMSVKKAHRTGHIARRVSSDTDLPRKIKWGSLYYFQTTPPEQAPPQKNRAGGISRRAP